MHRRVYTPPGSSRKPRTVVTITGQGVKVRVRGMALQIEDGWPLEGPLQQRTITRVTSRIERILFTAGSGFVTVSALDWCAENDIPIVAVSQSGELRWTLLPGKGGAWQAALRRAQALAPFTDTGLEIARWLVARKIEGQRDVLRELNARGATLRQSWPTFDVSQALTALTTTLSRLEHAQTIPALRQLEAEAAADAYWSGWIGLPLHFAPPSYRKRTPAHWTTFRGRGSPLNQGNRNAADPANALLNYAYALLEAEARIACHAAGLDPTLGILHTDQESRASLLYDITEPVRPVADRLVLSLLLGHAFRPGELWALRDGRCRLDQDLCATLWPWMPEFRRALGPVMAYVIGRLRDGPRYGERRAYRLVEVPSEITTRAPLGRKRWARDIAPPTLRTVHACRRCGVLLDDERTDRRYCDACLPARQRETTTALATSGPDALARRRREVHDPMFSEEARRKLGAAIAKRNREAARWTRTHPGPHDPATFTKTILPRLAQVPLRVIMKATGLSIRSCSRIRQGRAVPHPRHFEALRTLADKRTHENESSS